MGGQIWVESELGVGTRVAFTLPVMEGDYAEEDTGD
jgi:signal transduction histidine kinase